MTHLCDAKMHSRPDRSTKWLWVQCRFVPLVVDFWLMFLYFCQIHPCQWSCQMQRVWKSSDSDTGPRFCVTLPPSPFVFLGITVLRELIFSSPQIFFSPGLTINPSPWKSGRCVVDGENGKMIFDFYSVNCLVRWIVHRIVKVWERRGEKFYYHW